MQVLDVAPGPEGFALVLHGGAGGRSKYLTPDERAEFAAGLADAFAAGRAVLSAGGAALDAVCAAVGVLEDCPLYNAGRGAALTARGEAELDASVMTGDGRAGAVAVLRRIKHPVLAARKVMEETRHVLLVGPSDQVVEGWGLEIVDPSYFVTEARLAELARVREGQALPSRHGTVGAVALDVHGHLAAATSTGGMVNQHEGRIGDTPIVGAGTYARDGVVAVSCTGEGEAFIKGVVAHEIYARMHYSGMRLPDALAATIEAELETRNAEGGLIAVAANGEVAIAHNALAMFAAYELNGVLVTLT